MSERIPNYTKNELVTAIYWAVRNSEIPLTRLEICRAIGRHKSTHIVNTIKALAAEGWLAEEPGQDKFGRTAFRYRSGKDVLAEAAA